MSHLSNAVPTAILATMGEASAALRRPTPPPPPPPRKSRLRRLVRRLLLLLTASSILSQALAMPRPLPQVSFQSASGHANSTADGEPRRASFQPTSEPLRFVLMGTADTRTGDGIISVETPLAPAVCMSRNALRALHAYVGTDTSSAKYRTAANAIQQMTRANQQIENMLWALNFSNKIDAICSRKEYQVEWPAFNMSVRVGHTFDRHKRSPAMAFPALFAKHASKRLAITVAKKGIKTVAKQSGLFHSEEDKADVSLHPWNPLELVIFGGLALAKQAMWTVSRRQRRLAAYVDEAHTRIGQNAVAINFALSNVYDLSESLFLMEVARHVDQVADNIRHVTNSLSDSRLDLAIVDHGAFQRAISQLATLAQQEDKALPDTSAIAMLQLDTSYMLEESTGNLNIYLRIPLFSPALELQLYKFIQAPLPSADGLLQINTNLQYLAVTTATSGVFFGLTADQFHQCRTTQGRFMCPQVRTLLREDSSIRRRDDVRCLYSIKAGDSDGMEQYCRFKAADAAEAVYPLDDRSFLFFAETETKVEVFCARDDLPQQLVIPAGHSIVTIPLGCRAQSKARQLWTASTIQAQKITTTSAWPQPSAIRALFSMQQQRVRTMVTQQATIRDVQPVRNPATTPAALSAYSLGGLATILISALSYTHRHRISAIASSATSRPPPPPAPAPPPRSTAAQPSSLYPELRQAPPATHRTSGPRPSSSVYANFNHHAPH